MEPIEIAVRGYIKTKFPTFFEKPDLIEVQNFSRIIVVDPETTTEQFQNLKFGSYAIYVNYKKVSGGIFYDPNKVTEKELKILQKCAEIIIPVRKFVDEIFLPEIYDAQTLCVGFNLPFDLSRLAISFGYGRKSNRGSFSFKITENKKYPRLIIKHIDSTKSFIKFGTSGLQKEQYRGNFLDLRTLSFSLSNEKHTLESACEFFHSKFKKHSSNEHGKITKNYVRYNQKDVRATYHLYLALTKEYKKYNLSKPITKIYSPASIGKGLLEDIGILPFYQISKVEIKTLGLLMTTYIGARSEVRTRLKPVLVRYLDFLSMYPTICILLDLWSFIIAEEIHEEECTEWASNFVAKITLDDLNNPANWKNLSVLVCVKPDEDIFPIRARYGNNYSYNVGINHVSYNGNLWFCLADVVSSKILSRKTPEIIKAIRFVPNGIQKNLRKAKVLRKNLDPYQDIFKQIIEKRQQFKDKKDPREHILKIIANSTSYGIYAQINTENRKSKVDVYGHEYFTASVDKIEKQGEWFNPILATLITSGSRLILAIVEALLARHGKTYAFCDTDSMAIPDDMVDVVQSYFQKLNPYSFDKPLFKLEDENFVDGKLHDLWFYGVSAKRYVLYNIVNGKIIIRKHSSHGLGHILNPFSKDKDWEAEFWLDILRYHYEEISQEEIDLKYGNLYAISQISISTPSLLSRFGKINNKKALDMRVKPFNFCLVGYGRNDSVKPLSPYRKNSQECVFDEFVDYNTGQALKGIHYWRPMNEVFWEYVNHPESKFDGNIGILKRKHLAVSNVVTIGKESNQIDESEILGLDEKSYLTYDKQTIPIKDILVKLTLKEARAVGISKNQYYRIKKKITKKSFNFNKKTLNKLSKVILQQYIQNSLNRHNFHYNHKLLAESNMCREKMWS